jgi:hypothetical protein
MMHHRMTFRQWRRWRRFQAVNRVMGWIGLGCFLVAVLGTWIALIGGR